jgi:hypothetical protein
LKKTTVTGPPEPDDTGKMTSDEARRALEEAHRIAASVAPAIEAANRAAASMAPIIESTNRAMASMAPIIEQATRAAASLTPTLEAADRAAASLTPSLEAANQAAASFVPIFDAANRATASFAPTLDATNRAAASLEPTMRAVESAFRPPWWDGLSPIPSIYNDVIRTAEASNSRLREIEERQRDRIEAAAQPTAEPVPQEIRDLAAVARELALQVGSIAAVASQSAVDLAALNTTMTQATNSAKTQGYIIVGLSVVLVFLTAAIFWLTWVVANRPPGQ